MMDSREETDRHVPDKFKEAQKQWQNFKEEYSQFLEGPDEIEFEDDSEWRAADSQDTDQIEHSVPS